MSSVYGFPVEMKRSISARGMHVAMSEEISSSHEEKFYEHYRLLLSYFSQSTWKSCRSIPSSVSFHQFIFGQQQHR